MNEIPAENIEFSGIGSSGFEGTGWEKRGRPPWNLWLGSGLGHVRWAACSVPTRVPRRVRSGARQSARMAGRVGTAGSDRGAASRKPATFGSGAPRPKKSTVSATVERKVDVEAAATTFVAGDRVSHKTFGPGTVISAARRYDRGPVRAFRPDEEAHEGICAHRQTRLADRHSTLIQFLPLQKRRSGGRRT